MLREFYCAHSCRTRLFAASGLVVFVAHQGFRAYLKYALNEWYGRFYDTLQQAVEFASGDADDAWRADQRAKVWAQLLEFATIVAPAVAVHPVAGYIRNRWVLAWRLALVESYVALWDTAHPPIEGASQRVHEDTQRFAAGVQGCVATVLDALLTLVVFCPLLWRLDPALMAVAVATAVAGVGVSALVGRHLVDLEVGNQKAEAALRRGLVVLEVEPGSFLPDAEAQGAGGAQALGPVAVPPHRIDAAFVPLINALYANYRRLYANFAALMLWLSTYDQFATLLPYLMVAPRLFAGRRGRRAHAGHAHAVGQRVWQGLRLAEHRLRELAPGERVPLRPPPAAPVRGRHLGAARARRAPSSSPTASSSATPPPRRPPAPASAPPPTAAHAARRRDPMAATGASVARSPPRRVGPEVAKPERV